MKIELDKQDIDSILIAHVAENFGPSFNSITWDSYSYNRSATIKHEESIAPVPEDPA